ncbi:MAG: YkgJ family cysteine cluster protein [Proteobacteria bacterium]|nr:YkgJ family cysteine cluster protein [Pseudomonadota bacterium]
MTAFWKNGLQFSCTQCGRCCCGEPGVVYFSPGEFDRLAAFLQETRQLSRETILRDMMRPCQDAYSARDDFPDGHCIFYDNGCTVYPVRPSQCRDFPFWRTNLHSASDWNQLSPQCPGINQGKLWTAEEICAIASKSRI